jgi:hypothetical protein
MYNVVVKLHLMMFGRLDVNEKTIFLCMPVVNANLECYLQVQNYFDLWEHGDETGSNDCTKSLTHKYFLKRQGLH